MQIRMRRVGYSRQEKAESRRRSVAPELVVSFASTHPSFNLWRQSSINSKTELKQEEPKLKQSNSV